jgi:hypothetical protein
MDHLTKVSAAIIKDGDKILLCQRPKGKRHELLWEFPGGKIEPNETEEDCIIREIQEELDVTLGNLKRLTTIQADDVSITYFEATIISGKLKMIEHNDIKWVNRKEIINFNLCPNDKLMTEKISF